ncbi:hypothetical protein [Paenibacillus shenyangensis]|uniref:hypothetical protein n=1 Tax=Paenibacillus sp. A9 TaxID=1284352 RepID=UPI001EE711CD|nr:hypothetical protein [Paenibacillus sp. A9]
MQRVGSSDASYACAAHSLFTVYCYVPVIYLLIYVRVQTGDSSVRLPAGGQHKAASGQEAAETVSSYQRSLNHFPTLA